ncbi:molecular chaperone DnaJ [Sphingorhabdus sp. EL138]|uniref:molecular chaperone DnaJ n=1 Tax=Sphingorhabdus sp. EL138 TaxID=2073156 RepID=UPI0025F7D793|nr:molecular chaperone DnaJ [Sphingorhabdus sp. EL138]
MTFLAILAFLALGWAVWKGKLQKQQLLPILLGLAGAFLAARGSLWIGLPAIGVAVLWYRGLSLRLLGSRAKQDNASDIDAARFLLGVSRFDDAERIRERHRALIAQDHPDTGGSAERAAALNKARDLLLDDLNNKRL